MSATRRDIYEAGRADERAEIVAWLEAISAGARPVPVVTGSPPSTAARLACGVLAAQIGRGEHAVEEVLGDVGAG